MQARGPGPSRQRCAQDEITYLRAWCSVANHDLDAALGLFGTIRHSLAVGLPAAITLDIADILADNGHADEAQHLLAKYAITELDVRDVLAATYFEIGRSDDAREINGWSLETAAVDEPARCHRLVREVVLADAFDRQELVRKLRVVEGTASACSPLVNTLRCWVAQSFDCWSYLSDRGLDDGNARLLAAYTDWPKAAADWNLWRAMAALATSAGDLDGAVDLGVPALEAALRTSACTGERRAEVIKMARKFLEIPHVASSLQIRIEALANVTASQCAAQAGYQP